MLEDNQINPKNIDEELSILSLKLFASFYPKFFFLETTLKERLYDAVKSYMGQDWFKNQLATLENQLFQEEVKNILRRKPHGFQLTDKGLSVETGLGFWVEFFNRDLYKATKGIPIKIFTKKPLHIKRSDIYRRLDLVRDVRNQVVHHRIPVINSFSQLKYLDKLQQGNEYLTELLDWMDVQSTLTDASSTDELIDTIRHQVTHHKH